MTNDNSERVVEHQRFGFQGHYCSQEMNPLQQCLVPNCILNHPTLKVGDPIPKEQNLKVLVVGIGTEKMPSSLLREIAERQSVPVQVSPTRRRVRVICAYDKQFGQFGLADAAHNEQWHNVTMDERGTRLLFNADELEFLDSTPSAEQEKPQIDWKNAPEWAMWAAMDADNHWFYFQEKPTLNIDTWSCSGNLNCEDALRRGKPAPALHPNWKSSLVQRPESAKGGEDEATKLAWKFIRELEKAHGSMGTACEVISGHIPPTVNIALQYLRPQFWIQEVVEKLRAELQSRIATLEKENAALLKDKAIVDWLEENHEHISHISQIETPRGFPDRLWTLFGNEDTKRGRELYLNCHSTRGKTFIEMILAAMHSGETKS